MLSFHVKIAIFTLMVAPATAQQLGPYHWPTQITKEGKLRVLKFEKGAYFDVDLSELDVDPALLGSRNPLPSYFAVEPDFKAELLRHGQAKLKSPDLAPKNLKEAEANARASEVGIWKPKKVTASSDAIFADAQAKSPASIASSASATASTPPLSIQNLKDGIAFWGGLGTLIASAIGLAAFLANSYRRRRICFILFGLPSTGKTWISMRLADPELTKQTLSEAIERTRTVTKTKDPIVHTIGRYEISHINVDIPGAAPGDQLLHLTRKGSAGKFGKQIWIIILATTQNSSAQFASPESAKIDMSFISEQYGSLNLPISVLQSGKFPKPDLVVVAITKSDLFVQSEPVDYTKSSEMDRLSGFFNKHILALRAECEKQNVPIVVEKCSALEGWRVESMRRHIHKKLFPSS